MMYTINKYKGLVGVERTKQRVGSGSAHARCITLQNRAVFVGKEMRQRQSLSKGLECLRDGSEAKVAGGREKG